MTHQSKRQKKNCFQYHIREVNFEISKSVISKLFILGKQKMKVYMTLLKLITSNTYFKIYMKKIIY